MNCTFAGCFQFFVFSGFLAVARGTTVASTYGVASVDERSDAARILADPFQSRFTYYSLGALPNNSPMPYLQNLMFRLRDIPARFIESPIMLRNGHELMNRMVTDPTFRGAFVTNDVRETVTRSILEFGGELHPLANLARSANVVVKHANGRFMGYNTEVSAIQNAIAEQVNRVGLQALPSVLIVGAGVIGRSAIAAVIASQIPFQRVSLIGSDDQAVQTLVQMFSLTPYSEDSQFSLIIGTVPAEVQHGLMGRYPRVFGNSEAQSTVPPLVVLDVAYTHQPTPLVRWGMRVRRDPASYVWQKDDQRVFFVTLSTVAHELWTQALIMDGEIQETSLTKAAVDLPLMVAKSRLFVQSNP